MEPADGRRGLEHLQRCSVCDLAKIFSHPSLVMYSFATPPIKLKLGQEIDGGLLANRNTEQLGHILLHRCRALLRSLPATATQAIM